MAFERFPWKTDSLLVHFVSTPPKIFSKFQYHFKVSLKNKFPSGWIITFELLSKVLLVMSFKLKMVWLKLSLLSYIPKCYWLLSKILLVMSVSLKNKFPSGRNYHFWATFQSVIGYEFWIEDGLVEIITFELLPKVL